MKIFIATDIRLYKVNNHIFAGDEFTKILKRYNDAFGKIIICTRIISSNKIPNGCSEVSSYIEEYITIDGLMKVFTNKYNNLMKAKIKSCDLVIARVPSIVAYKAVDIAKSIGVPYLTEVMGCAWDSYWNHGILGKLLAPYMYWKMKNIIRDANYATYVTEKWLQIRYPCKNRSINASNVSISDTDDIILKKRIDKINDMSRINIKLMTAAAVDNRTKGHEYVIKVLRRFSDKNINIEYYLAGKGDPTFLRNLASKYNVENQVFFLGRLNHNDVLKAMDDIDIYVQASKQEGLPRSMIEAMSRGCPTIGARTGGIPELISEECIFKKGSTKSLEKTLTKIINSNLEKYANENFENSKKYTETILNKRRNGYYNNIVKDLN